jgi:cytochrome c6
VTVFALSGSHKLGLGLIGLAFIVFALVSSMVIPRRRAQFPSNVPGFVAVTAVFFGAMLFAVFYFGKESHAGNEALGVTGTTTVAGAPPQKPFNSTSTTSPASTPSTPAPSNANLVAGKKVFQTAGCASCHTLKDAGATGKVGPNLDQLKPDEQRVAQQVTNGGAIMPAFKNSLGTKQIQDVAAYVSSVAGKA